MICYAIKINKMTITNLKKITIVGFMGTIAAFVLFLSSCAVESKSKPRILISSDIGGTDPDDFQSMIHLFMYSDSFKIEGLVSSPFGNGQKQDILDIINVYDKDFPQLKQHNKSLTDPNTLREICKQGGKSEASYKGFSTATEGVELGC